MNHEIKKSLRKILAVLTVCFFVLQMTNIGATKANFSNREISEGNSFTAGEWGGDTTLKPGDVVINEVMWMGSTADGDDEWIELRNTTNHDIDLSNWDIENGGSGAGHIEIPNGYKIKANGYFLITKKKWDETLINLSADLTSDKGNTHVSGMNLHNDGEQLILEDKGDKIIDTAWIDTTPRTIWPDGYHASSSTGLHRSMERDTIPGDGTLAESWHTCIDIACNDITYWDTEGNNYGTPGAANLSDEENSEEDKNLKTLDNAKEEIETEVPAEGSTEIPTEIIIEPEADSTSSPQADSPQADSPQAESEIIEEADEPEIIVEEEKKAEEAELPVEPSIPEKGISEEIK